MLTDEEYQKIKKKIEILIKINSINDFNTLQELYEKQEFNVRIELILSLQDLIKSKFNSLYEAKFAATRENINSKLNTAQIVNYNGKEVKVVELNSNFSMLVHSNDSGFVEKGKTFDSYVEAWIKTYNPKTHGLATSFISDSNFGTAPVIGEGVLYGFYDIKSSDIFGMAPYDLNSHINNYGYGSGNTKIYLSPEEMSISSNRVYNEFILSREASKPSCVIIYDDSTIEKVENAYKAASEWGIPVVKINRTELAKSHMQLISSLVEDFNYSGDYDKLNVAIQLFESSTSGLQLNKVDGTGQVDSINKVDNSSFLEIFDSNTLTKVFDSIFENGNQEDKRKLLNILTDMKNRYSITSENGTKAIPQTASLLNIDEYISKLKGDV